METILWLGLGREKDRPMRRTTGDSTYTVSIQLVFASNKLVYISNSYPSPGCISPKNTELKHTMVMKTNVFDEPLVLGIDIFRSVAYLQFDYRNTGYRYVNVTKFISNYLHRYLCQVQEWWLFQLRTFLLLLDVFILNLVCGYTRI